MTTVKDKNSCPKDQLCFCPPGGVQRADERQQGKAFELEPGRGGGEEEGGQPARQPCSPWERDSQPPPSYTGSLREKKLTIGCKIHKQDAKKLKDAVSALCARHGGGGGGEDGEEREDTEKSEVMKKDFGKKYIFLKGGEAEGIL